MLWRGNIEAKEYAINAHKGQRRKSDKEKPMVIHPIIVANILKEYGSDVILYLSTYNKLILEKIGNKYDKDKINKEKYKII